MSQKRVQTLEPLAKIDYDKATKQVERSDAADKLLRSSDFSNNESVKVVCMIEKDGNQYILISQFEAKIYFSIEFRNF